MKKTWVRKTLSIGVLAAGALLLAPAAAQATDPSHGQLPGHSAGTIAHNLAHHSGGQSGLSQGRSGLGGLAHNLAHNTGAQPSRMTGHSTVGNDMLYGAGGHHGLNPFHGANSMQGLSQHLGQNAHQGFTGLDGVGQLAHNVAHPRTYYRTIQVQQPVTVYQPVSMAHGAMPTYAVGDFAHNLVHGTGMGMGQSQAGASSIAGLAHNIAHAGDSRKNVTTHVPGAPLPQNHGGHGFDIAPGFDSGHDFVEAPTPGFNSAHDFVEAPTPGFDSGHDFVDVPAPAADGIGFPSNDQVVIPANYCGSSLSVHGAAHDSTCAFTQPQQPVHAVPGHPAPVHPAPGHPAPVHPAPGHVNQPGHPGVGHTPDVPGGVAGDHGGYDAGELPADTGYGGQAPADVSNAGYGGQAPADVSNAGYGGQAPADVSDAGYGGQAPADVSDAGYGGQAPADVSDAGYGGQAPADVSDAGYGGQAPADVSDAGYGGQAPADVRGDNGYGGQAPAAANEAPTDVRGDNGYGGELPDRYGNNSRASERSTLDRLTDLGLRSAGLGGGLGMLNTLR